MILRASIHKVKDPERVVDLQGTRGMLNGWEKRACTQGDQIALRVKAWTKQSEKGKEG